MVGQKVNNVTGATVLNRFTRVCMQGCSPRAPLPAMYDPAYKGVKQPHHPIRLNTGFREDVKMWQNFIDNWNRRNLFLNPVWEDSNTLKLHTDAAASIGYGGIFQTS